tara:strand:+ start:3491 stop:4600 length:1110 start_codon:yes stop_codon:yes gene_type:complete
MVIIKMKFTRYLYTEDEVILTFLEQLLKQENLDECYFWIYEYYKSGFVSETWNLLYKIYYDFYALQNPKLEKKINDYYDKYKNDNNIKHVLCVVKNLFRFKKDYDILMLRIYYSKIKQGNFKIEEVSKIKNYTIKKKEEIFLANAINKKDFHFIAFYLKNIIDSTDFNDVIKLLNCILNKKISLNDNYNDKYHQLLVFITNSLNNIRPNKKVCYKIVNIREIKRVLKTDEECYNEGKHEDVSHAYKTLGKHRLYSISKNIGCFKLERKNVDLTQLFWYNWEYYAYKSPLWKNRFSKYKIKLNHEKQLIDFDDDDELEEFYFRYGYEPDEQKQEIQDKSTLQIKNNHIYNWINEIFDKKMEKKIKTKIKY